MVNLDVDIFAGKSCSLETLLISKERTVCQRKRLEKNPLCTCTLVLKVNMPGPVKNNIASASFFKNGCNLIFTEFSESILDKEVHPRCAQGPVLLLALSCSPSVAKALAVKLESLYPWTRMLDIDVYKKGSCESIHRNSQRKCFVCNSMAASCARNQSHGRLEVVRAIESMFLDLSAFYYGELAYQSLLQELDCTPKPGLVDRNNSGSHCDMDYSLMKKSAETLRPWFYRMAKASTFEDLRETGKLAEAAMLHATGGVNTHKGAIFCLGLLAWAAVQTYPANPKSVSSKIKEVCKDLPLSPQAQNRLSKFGFSGAMDNAKTGYSFLISKVLPVFKRDLKTTDTNTALVNALLLIMSVNNDTNILQRSDIETMQNVKNRCKSLIGSPLSEIENLDRLFIQKNLSPGGSADLLAATWFLSHL